MAFALFFSAPELRTIAVQLARPDLPATLRSNAARIWDGGFNKWQSPRPAPYVRAKGNPFKRLTVVQASPHLMGFRSLLAGIVDAFPTDPNAQALAPIISALDLGTLGNNDVAVEPWAIG